MVKKFKQYFEEKTVLGLIEFFHIDGVGKVAAKLDSGNGAFNVLHGEDIQLQGDKVFFRTVNGRTLVKDKKDGLKVILKSLFGYFFYEIPPMPHSAL